ncbi:uncharacterized protein LOC114937300 isoform X2 [Nylanderia fulva]|uniref:uncharacterized protein LOC114937300 isoform X2 n=1 Tax=Nylanderia fulva TaxID=613905 RepID=UPI0010FB97E8|nr:uncharacterized protein LOC114937300 isoform X2 [Nylanderia fulva]
MSYHILNNRLLIRFNNKLNERLEWYSQQTSVTSEKRMEFSFYVDEIRYLLTQFPRGLNCYLLVNYCEINKSHYMKLRLIKNELTKLMLKPEKEQFLEKTVILLAQYVQMPKYVYYSSISASLDRIADEVLNCLKKKHPYHSILSTSDEFFSYWKYHNIDDNHWNEVESTQIMDILQEYIFGKLNFRPRLCGYNDFDYLCIDYVFTKLSLWESI